jgi:hypothetical protein
MNLHFSFCFKIENICRLSELLLLVVVVVVVVVEEETKLSLKII